ncbi:hypothetical protein ABIB62_001372 [Mucilaginibacter sp. UYP25]|uniref:hypothetical protein n=1 Tax=unclassified Mucilaginibacter TaxID=2617802 RepID=UPI00339B12D2
MKFIKTLILSAIAMGTVAVSSCTKDDNKATASGTITATIDGKVTTFDKNLVGGTSTVNSNTFTSIQGDDDAGNNLSITVVGVLTPGKIFKSNDANEQNRPIVIYTAVNNDSYVNDDNAVSNIVTVAVSAAASNNIEGTFSGGLTTLVVGNGTAKTKTVTNGKFNVALTN